MLAPPLHKLRSAGKPVLLTNSRLGFSQKMTYLSATRCPIPELSQLLRLMVVAAQKPEFFQESRPL